MMPILPAGFLVAFAFLSRMESERDPRGFFWRGGGRFATATFAAFLLLVLKTTTGKFDPLLTVLALLVLLPGPLRPRPSLEAAPLLRSGAVTVGVGLVSALVAGVVWGSLDPIPLVHDEAAYVLQAQLFASGRWTGVARPLPEFFEQMQLFLTPALASKYPPGHSLVLVPGIWLGVPVLMPLLLTGAAGALIFAHARRVAGASVALVAWLLWVSAPGTFAARASYLSQNTTTVLWLLALWALREWMSSGSKTWLIILASCVGLGAITRPMTMFALSLPIGFVFLRRAARFHRWKDLGIAALVGSLFLALGVLWSVRTIGQWRTTPYREYSRVYFPYEWTGFGERPDPPVRRIPPGMDSFDAEFRRLHANHTVSALPDILGARLRTIVADQWSQGRMFLEVFSVLGALTLCSQGLFVLVSAVLLVLAHLYMAHFSSWTVYYLEIQPVLSFLAAIGLCGVIASTLLVLGERRNRPAIQRAVYLGLVAILVVQLGAATATAMAERQSDAAGMTAFRRGVERLPESKLVVFVRYGPNHDVHRNLVVNGPDLDGARAWIVHDLAERNDRLMALAPERKAYLYDEESGSFSAMGTKSGRELDRNGKHPPGE